jgi:hypothetical protein
VKCGGHLALDFPQLCGSKIAAAGDGYLLSRLGMFSQLIVMIQQIGWQRMRRMVFWRREIQDVSGRHMYRRHDMLEVSLFPPGFTDAFDNHRLSVRCKEARDVNVYGLGEFGLTEVRGAMEGLQKRSESGSSVVR